ncbi:hypothetical protein [Acidisoma cladoniae]|uniref:hypothetical protein n=1 Tax=Acidisoma cladoniae TaxID=3040935 RepID=UPI00254CF362|nr:hypothetical protein [Acidisoma sp. PAMC 29798]
MALFDIAMLDMLCVILCFVFLCGAIIMPLAGFVICMDELLELLMADCAKATGVPIMAQVIVAAKTRA